MNLYWIPMFDLDISLHISVKQSNFFLQIIRMRTFCKNFIFYMCWCPFLSHSTIFSNNSTPLNQLQTAYFLTAIIFPNDYNALTHLMWCKKLVAVTLWKDWKSHIVVTIITIKFPILKHEKKKFKISVQRKQFNELILFTWWTIQSKLSVC